MSMDFLFFSNTGWRTMDGAHRPAQFAYELLRRGHRVLFVELEHSPDRPREENLRVAGPEELGITEREITRAWYGQAYGALEAWRAGVARGLDEFERAAPGERVAIWTLPFAPLVELAPMLKARGYRLVYDCLDDFEGLEAAGYHLYFPQVEDYLVTQSDLVVVLSTTLEDKFSGRANAIALIRDGVHLQDFAGLSPARPVGPDLHLGFWGTLNHFMIDVPLLEHVAAARPNWQLDLIGPYDFDPLSPRIGPRLASHPNIHLLGRQPHAALSGLLKTFDVCLIPSPVDRFNLGRDPVKTYEYLAGYRPVVATALRQLQGLPYVYLASGPDDLVRQVERAAATPVDPQVVDRFLAEQTWERRVDQLLEAVCAAPDRRAVAPFTPPHRESAEAAGAYIAHLERLVDERTAVIASMHRALAETGVRPALRRGWKKIRGIIRADSADR